MFRHVVMFRWKPGTSSDVVESIEARLAALPAAIPQVRDFRFGRDAGLNDGNFDFVVVAGFDSADDYLVYRDHPEHRAFVQDELLPNIVERGAVQYAVD